MSISISPYRRKVQYYETDKMQVTHHANYLHYMEEARIDFMDQLGWGYDRMEREGLASPVLSVNCQYRRSTTFPDVLEIAVSIKDLKAAKLTLGYTMTVDGETVCTAESVHCFLADGGRPVSLKRRWPEFYQLLEELTQPLAE